MTSPPKYSILICTNAKPSKFKQLDNLVSQIILQTTHHFEVIIVANGMPSEHYEELVVHLNENNYNNLRVIYSSTPSLSRARNQAIKQSNGHYLFFLDDDNTLQPGYFNFLLEVLVDDNCEAVGGVVKLDSGLHLPRWFDENMSRFLVSRTQPEEISTISPRIYILGASMAFPINTFRVHGFFDEGLGRQHNNLLSGEDSEFILRLDPENVYIHPKAVITIGEVQHRLSRCFFLRRYFWQGVTDAKIVHKLGFIPYDHDELRLSILFIQRLWHDLYTLKIFHFCCRVLRWLTYIIYLATLRSCYKSITALMSNLWI